jgi:GNAT superfamily N-acetyltransferase
MAEGERRRRGMRDGGRALAFMPATECQPGMVASLLLRSYADLLAEQYWEGEKEKWFRFDREVYENPQTVGDCVFFTRLGDETVGFASFDPRGAPECAAIGHNCILPEFRRRGYGKRQILEVLSRLRTMGIRTAVVSTSEHPFFFPARRMYLSCGFQETRRYTGGPDPRYGLVVYETEL